MTNRHLLACALGALALLAAVPARATSFVYDAGAAVAIPKSDYQVNPTIPSNEKIVAADWNQLGQAAYDLRQAILTGYFHGLTAQTATPPAPAFGIILYDMLDGGGLWAEFPDAGTEQVFDGLQQMDNLWVRARASIDGGLTVGHGSIYALTGVVGASEIDFNNAYSYGGGTGISLNGDVVDGATAVGVILNNDQTFNTAGARIVSFRNNNSTKAYVDYGGLGVFDGGVDLGVSGNLFNADTITAQSGQTIILNGESSSFTPAVVVDTPGVAHTAGNLFVVDNNSIFKFFVTWTGQAEAVGGFDFNSQKGTRVLAGTISTDAVNFGQLGQNSLAGDSFGVATSVAFAAQISGASATTLRLTVTAIVPGTIAAGPCTETISIVDVTSATTLCSQGMGSGAGASDPAGSVETTSCSGLIISASDKLVAEYTANTCTTGHGEHAVNASWK